MLDKKAVKECQIIFRATPKEKQLLEIMANGSNRSMSNYIRQKVLVENKDIIKAKASLKKEN